MKLRKNDPYKTYLEGLGFSGIAPAVQRNDPQQIRAFSYEQFDPPTVRQTLGKAKAHCPGLFVFVPKAGRAVRVDSEKCLIVLGNGKNAVRALLQTVVQKAKG